MEDAAAEGPAVAIAYQQRRPVADMPRGVTLVSGVDGTLLVVAEPWQRQQLGRSSFRFEWQRLIPGTRGRDDIVEDWLP